MILNKVLVACMAIVLVGAFVPAVVMAEYNEDNQPKVIDDQNAKYKAMLEEQRRADALKAKQEVKKERLEGQKLKNCQQREKNVTKIMSRIGDRGQKHIDLITKISERTQKFYVDKGLSLSNYDALVADVNSKKSAAQTAVDATKSTIVQFKCDGDNPKAKANSFKQFKDSQGDALKAYKTSVKNLIVGVKSSKNQAGGEQ